MMHQFNAEPDQDPPEKQYPDNPPKQDAVLVLLWHLETCEDQRHHKQVINTQGFFQQIPRQEFEGCFFATHGFMDVSSEVQPVELIGEINPDIKYHGQHYPAKSTV